jgi:hypothetical protein
VRAALRHRLQQKGLGPVFRLGDLALDFLARKVTVAGAEVKLSKREFEGGEINFPEYGPKSFKLPTGTACVFSCSLLHQVSPVTAGKRYAFLPFLYDDAAAKLREANNEFLGEGVGAYKA